jgi:hypothetical protein
MHLQLVCCCAEVRYSAHCMQVCRLYTAAASCVASANGLHHHFTLATRVSHLVDELGVVHEVVQGGGGPADLGHRSVCCRLGGLIAQPALEQGLDASHTLQTHS